MVTLALVQGVVNTFVIFLARVIGHIVDRVILKNERGHGIGFWVSTIIAEIVLAVLASIIVMWFSRRREFRADAGGAALAGREKMIAALKKLQAAHQPEPHRIQGGLIQRSSRLLKSVNGQPVEARKTLKVPVKTGQRKPKGHTEGRQVRIGAHPVQAPGR